MNEGRRRQGGDCEAFAERDGIEGDGLQVSPRKVDLDEIKFVSLCARYGKRCQLWCQDCEVEGRCVEP